MSASSPPKAAAMLSIMAGSNLLGRTLILEFSALSGIFSRVFGGVDGASVVAKGVGVVVVVVVVVVDVVVVVVVRGTVEEPKRPASASSKASLLMSKI
jgi:hypothetical protein